MTDSTDPSQSTSMGASLGSKKVKLHVGQHGPSMFRPNMHVGNPMKDGLSESLSPFGLNHAVKKLILWCSSSR